MFTIKIENNYGYSGRLVNTDTNRDWIINHHFTSASIPDLKSALLQIYGLGEVLFLDLGEEKIKGYPFPSERYGLLIRCHSTEFYYRFEQHGDIYLTIDGREVEVTEVVKDVNSYNKKRFPDSVYLGQVTKWVRQVKYD